ncbi:hypothetical protein GWI34_34795, partial [Actinomadura sp. DSM 109109]|nr:hypothetical protein [Actinomadura lepetitiana]
MDTARPAGAAAACPARVAMVGWFGFNVGLGGAAAAALGGVPVVAGVAALTVPTVAVLV